jgi:hypothetical protein
MKLQAHLPMVTIGARDWHAAMIALVSLFGAAMLLLASQSGALLNNPSFERLQTSPIISVPDRISLDLHLWNPPISPWGRFSVAHPLPENAVLSQEFSIGMDERAVFEVFGDAALRGMLAEKGTVPQLKPRNDRLMLMLMLLRLGTRRS